MRFFIVTFALLAGAISLYASCQDLPEKPSLGQVVKSTIPPESPHQPGISFPQASKDFLKPSEEFQFYQSLMEDWCRHLRGIKGIPDEYATTAETIKSHLIQHFSKLIGQVRLKREQVKAIRGRPIPHPTLSDEDAAQAQLASLGWDRATHKETFLENVFLKAFNRLMTAKDKANQTLSKGLHQWYTLAYPSTDTEENHLHTHTIESWANQLENAPYDQYENISNEVFSQIMNRLSLCIATERHLRQHIDAFSCEEEEFTPHEYSQTSYEAAQKILDAIIQSSLCDQPLTADRIPLIVAQALRTNLPVLFQGFIDTANKLGLELHEVSLLYGRI